MVTLEEMRRQEAIYLRKLNNIEADYASQLAYYKKYMSPEAATKFEAAGVEGHKRELQSYLEGERVQIRAFEAATAMSQALNQKLPGYSCLPDVSWSDRAVITCNGADDQLGPVNVQVSAKPDGNYQTSIKVKRRAYGYIEGANITCNANSLEVEHTGFLKQGISDFVKKTLADIRKKSTSIRLNLDDDPVCNPPQEETEP